MKYPYTKFSRIVGKKTGNSLYEVWRVRGANDMTLVGYISRKPAGGWQVDVATAHGQKIRGFVYLKIAKEYATEILA